ncbi:MAG: RNA polymerase sigma factor [Phycisphaerales bacterium]
MTDPATRSVFDRCLAGEQQAWAEVVDHYSGFVYAIARSHRLTPEECDDVAQAVFTALFRRLGAIRDHAQVSAWIGQTCRRACWKLIRARRAADTAKASARAEAAYLPDPGLEQLEFTAALLRAFDDLDPRCQTLLRTLYGDAGGASYQQISESLGLSVGSIGPTRQRCLAKLARLMETKGEQEGSGRVPDNRPS